ncbi:MAG TPA: GTP-binding protein [Gemmataceae bacterium]|jgi:Ni2+-binding GTPase involved in maturation of urease and hydrogenase|nr:GTP-binding protein [Gemmataceae bacterium]
MGSLRFVLVGGFLGAGKTTAMARLARRYRDKGLKVGLVTNDQAEDLVDTKSLQAQGFPVEEVAGACFCCKFDDLIEKVDRLGNNRPDVIIAEPVGSCTDLIATVVQPLRDIYRERFQVAPYGVLFKPAHGLRILRNEADSGFSPKAAYIFKKQMEEADLILLNRIDELSPADRKSITELMQKNFPGTPVLPVSAKTGEGFDAYAAFLEQDGAFGRKILDIDYDIYAEGEAELGWLNGSVHVEAAKPLALDKLIVDIVKQLRAAFSKLGAEVAHLKAIGLGPTSFGVANLVSSGSKVELSLPSNQNVTTFDVIVNARAAGDPKELEEQVRATVAEVCKAHGCKPDFKTMQSFRPGRPMPTHRYAMAK